MSSDPPQARDLLVHEPFIRRLARNLLNDEHEAEDVVQDTWLALLSRPEESHRSSRSWLGRVAWNTAVDRFRRRERRVARERASAQSETLTPAGTTLDQAATRTKLAAALWALDEPYRSAVILRFYDDLSPREVAEKQGVPLETARTRIKRALAMLRVRLQHEHEREGRDWSLAIALLAGSYRGSIWEALRPRFLRFTPRARLFGAATGATLALVGVAWLTLEVRASGRRAVDVARAPGPPPLSVSHDLLQAPSSATERVALALETAGIENEGTPPAAARGAEFSGRTIDANGNVIAGAEVLAWNTWPPSGAPELLAVSDAAGNYRLAGLPAIFCVGARAGRLSAVEMIYAEPPDPRSYTGIDLVLGELPAVRGTVVDELGAPVAGAVVCVSSVDGAGNYRPTRHRGLYTALVPEHLTTSAQDGTFEQAAGPGLYCVSVLTPSSAQSWGFAVAEEPVEIVLAQGVELQVRVLAPDGTAVEGAQVTFKGKHELVPLFDQPAGRGIMSARTDAAGLCVRLARAQANEPFFVRCDAPGWGSTLFGPCEAGAADFPWNLRLSRQRRLEVRVLDADGGPVPDAEVSAAFIVDLERAYRLGFTPLEDLQLVARVRSDAGGTAILEGLPSCALQLWIEPPGESARGESRRVGSDQAELEVSLQSSTDSRADHERGVYEGCVRDGPSGATLADFTVTLLPNGDPSAPGFATFRAGEDAPGDGCYRLPVSGASADALLFQSPGRVTVLKRCPATTELVRRVDVELHPIRELSLRVLDEAEQPVANAWIRVVDAEDAPLCVPIRPRLVANSLRCGPDGIAHLLSLPAKPVRVLAAAHPRGEFQEFEFDLTFPISGMQDLRIVAPDLLRPPARFDLVLCRNDDGKAASASWEPAHPGSPFQGRIALRLSETSGRRWWTLRGKYDDGRFRLDADPAWSNIVFDDQERPIDVHRTTPQRWGFDLDGDGQTRITQLRDLPCPADGFRLEALVEGEEAAVFEIAPAEDESARRLCVRLPDPR